jgi:hypothetical protein
VSVAGTLTVADRVDRSLADGRRFRVVEELEVFCPLGLKFWDPVLDRPIRDGLIVHAWPLETSSPRVEAFRSLSGVYAFQGLPGLRSVERPAPDDPEVASPASPPVTRRYVVEVLDPGRRFLPAAFEVELPLPYRGVFLAGEPGGEGSPGSPAVAPPGFFLFSGPVRNRPPGIASVRGELAHAADGESAAHALIRVDLPGGVSHWSTADREGRFAVLFPYPTLVEELPPLGGSPPEIVSPPPPPIDERTWEITVTVFWEPAHLAPLPGTDQPEHRTVLTQAAADVLTAPPGSPLPPSEPSWTGVLGYGGEVIVKTAGSSRLWIVLPGGSPP